jgi:hypothetical protein
MTGETLTFDALLKSDLWQEFEKAAQVERRHPIELLADVITDFLEAQKGVALFDDIESELQITGYTEDDAVELVKAYRDSRRK